MSTLEIVKKYYTGIKQKSGWQAVIANDFTFIGPGQSTKGKDAYVEVTLRFLSAVKSSQIIELIMEENRACVLVDYELQSPKGNKSKFVVAEILNVNEGLITSSTIFYDTAAFRSFMSK